MIVASKVLVAVCILSGYPNMPKTIKGDVTFTTKNWVSVRKYNKSKTEYIELSFLKKNCKLRKKK